jgi:2-polyprenyl-3-methyl-5-hydroxy-6-metoxy-1,4-benzoquinol methylase
MVGGSPTGECAICGTDDWGTAYLGRVRDGRVGELTEQTREVLACRGCSAQKLVGDPVDYESNAYRDRVDGGHDAERFYALFDGAQADKLRLLPLGQLRGATLLDVGCAAGSFLDLVSGFCAQTIGVEPTRAYHAELARKGHQVFGSLEDAETSHGRVDVATAFDVIEHVPDPVGFLRAILAQLKPGGQLLVGTPNSSDWLLTLAGQPYQEFWYRVVHTWYLNERSLTQAAERAGATSWHTEHLQHYDLANALVWLRDRRPSGFGAIDVPAALDATYQRGLESDGRSDYVYLTLTK